MTRKLASGKKSTSFAFFEKRFDVPDYDNPKGQPSRTRWRILHTPWFGIYLHKWNKPDPRPTPHNHPWNFFSIILKGWYLEHHGYVYPTEPEFKDQYIHEYNTVDFFNWVPRTKFHTVVFVEPGTWSLMFVGRTHPDWGYDTADGYIPFDQHPHSEEFVTALKESKS